MVCGQREQSDSGRCSYVRDTSVTGRNLAAKLSSITISGAYKEAWPSLRCRAREYSVDIKAATLLVLPAMLPVPPPLHFTLFESCSCEVIG